jgi:hypothetical protein
MATTDYIPGKDADFDVFFQNLIDYVDTKTSGTPPAWPHIPGEAKDTLLEAYPVWHTAYLKTLGPHTKVDTEVKNERRKAALAIIRPFVAQYLRFPPVTNADRSAMGINNYDTTRTPTDVPTIHVGFSLEIKAVYEIQIRLWVLETEKHAIPANMNGVVAYWLVSDTPITEQKELICTKLITKHIDVLHFAPEERGKTVYVACRWESERGKEGEWSPIQSFVVP